MIMTATEGPLLGFAEAIVDYTKFATYEQAALSAGVQYGPKPGFKDPNCGQGLPIRYRYIDCSGFNRTIMWYSCALFMNQYPDGSPNQNTWLRDQGFKHGDESAYEAEAMNSDGLVRIAFHRPGGRGGDSIGHVWITVNGHTVESYGGHGPGQRPWNDSLLLSLVDDTYTIGRIL